MLAFCRFVTFAFLWMAAPSVGGRSSSAQASTTSTSQQDNRVVADGSTVLGAGAIIADSRSSYTTVNNADAARITQLNNQLLRDMSASNTDAVKTLANTVGAISDDARDLYATAGSNTARAWEHTVDASEQVITRLLSASENQNENAKSMVTLAMSAYQPADSKVGDAFKYAAIAGAVIAALSLFRK